MARSHKPSKMDYIKEKEFFKRISSKCNYIDEKIVRDVFYSMVKVIVQELKRSGIARLPDFGDFVVTFHKSRVSMDIHSGRYIHIPVRKTIKFITDYKLKKYFNM